MQHVTCENQVGVAASNGIEHRALHMSVFVGLVAYHSIQMRAEATTKLNSLCRRDAQIPIAELLLSTFIENETNHEIELGRSNTNAQ